MDTLDPAASLRNYNLVNGLRGGDPAVITPLLEIYSKNDAVRNSPDPLSLAIKCGKLATISLVLEQIPTLLNHQAIDGSTALHIAASLNRIDAVQILLSQQLIDDTILDSNGSTCIDVAATIECSSVISLSRAHFNDRYLELLHAYVTSPPSDSTSASAPAAASTGTPSRLVSSGQVSNSAAEELYQFMLLPRSTILNFSSQESTGQTILHESVERKDLGLVKLVLAKGGTNLIRNKAGKLPTELTTDTRIISVLSNSTTSVPTIKGFLFKWTNLARGYRSRWFVLDDQKMLSYYRTQEEEGKVSRGSISLSAASIKHTPGSEKFEITSKLGKNSFWLKTSHASEATRWVQVLKAAAALTDSPTSGSDFSRRNSMNSIRFTGGEKSADSILGDDETSYGDDDSGPPRRDHELLISGAKTSLETLRHLISSLLPDQQVEVKKALESLGLQLSHQFDEYVEATSEREKYFIKKYEKEIEIKGLWQDSMKELATQHATIEAELEKSGRENEKKRTVLREVRANLANSPPTTPASLVDANGKQIDPLALRTDSPEPLSLQSLALDSRSRSASLLSPRGVRSRGATLSGAQLEQMVQSALEDEDSDADDDEFFEAIESGTIPFTEESTTITSPNLTAEKFASQIDLVPYAGYKNLRKKLPIDSDNRPPVSLWAILKGSIGKDLSKISFPVFFNEPTSMLQRMAEDMEFSECLDAAAAERDPTKRIAYVAAFAMSNYSSTIGRIAKPFNPMLGETFEYVDLKKKYRYVGEQVSHHPPISASVAQSALWDYSGEVDVKSKFMGKSFELRPTGVAHVFLRIPIAWAPELPSAGPKFEGMVVEHYTWTKVTTSVSNFLFGAPIIDHFGDMIITNHRSDLRCRLTFKPRGWRGTGMEIKGSVYDEKSSKETWEIAGKWSSVLIARKVGTGIGELSVEGNIPNGDDYVRLWKNSEKPAGLPFALTPFAITLNDSNQDILDYVPPNDSRRRFDQQAFEHGDFERANELKSELEEFQRSTRREREKGEKGEHKPRWFNKRLDKDTGEVYWEPRRSESGNDLEYWEERNRVGSLKKEGKEASWKGVDKIFGKVE